MSYFLRSPIRTNKGHEATETEGLVELELTLSIEQSVIKQRKLAT